jgi:hypothetical protein
VWITPVLESRKTLWRIALLLLCVVLLAAGTVFVAFSWRRLSGSDDAELAGWCVMLGLGLSAAAAFIADQLFFTSSSPAASLRFVVLRHEGIEDPHFDLMIETTPGSPLATWRSPEWPITQPTVLTQLPDHRRDYLEYEGPISGNRGHVLRIAAGAYAISDIGGGAKLIQWNTRELSNIKLLRDGDHRWRAFPA